MFKSTTKKAKGTLIELRKTAYHHYGESPISFIKFIYYSIFRLNTFIIYENNLREKQPAHNLDDDFKVIIPDAAQLNKIRNGKDLPREFYYDKIHGVKNCYVAFCNNKLAYIHWIYRKGDYSRFLKLGDGVVELNYNTTLPEFRGRRLSAKMMGFICHELKKEGIKKVIGIIHEDNIASIKCIKLAGFKEVRRIKALGPFNRKYRYSI
jgi:RimJ/RimL family protein N-acetyltransferase